MVHRVVNANRSTENPDLFLLYEHHEDQTALQNHRETPHFKTIVEGPIVPLLDKRERELYEPVVDLAAAHPLKLLGAGLTESAATRISAALLSGDMVDFIEGGERSLAAAREAVDWAARAEHTIGAGPVHFELALVIGTGGANIPRERAPRASGLWPALERQRRGARRAAGRKY